MIRLENISIAYSSKTIIDRASVVFPQGSVTVLIGRNGAGKSTLLRSLTAVEAPKSGTIFIGGKDIFSLNYEQRAKLLSFVGTQRIRIANMLCRDVVATGRAPYTNWVGKLNSSDIEIVNNALDAVGMSSFAMRSIDTLSDGESQRIMIARALAQQTPTIMLDEPTAFLDIPTRFEICKLLSNLAHNQGKTIIFSTHDIDAALPIADYIAVLDNCKLSLHPASEAKEVIRTLFSL